jgi:aspartate-semialdehyde dehydrogenase
LKKVLMSTCQAASLHIYYLCIYYTLYIQYRYGLKKVLMSTYQAASGAGQEGMDELFDGAKKVIITDKLAL